MNKKCPPGVICIENITLCISIILCIFVIWFIKSNPPTMFVQTHDVANDTYIRPSAMVSNRSNDVLMNPYQPPLRDNSIYTNPLPVHIATSSVHTEYRQMGILTRTGNNELILPLMGKPLFVSRDKWNFYTMKDSNAMIKLPISYKGKSCTNEYGCDNLYNNDTVYVEGYNDTFKVTIYDNQNMKYIPYL